jgi:hypothetical protein
MVMAQYYRFYCNIAPYFIGSALGFDGTGLEDERVLAYFFEPADIKY